MLIKFSGRGFGLSTTVDVDPGTLIIEYRGEIISSVTCTERMSTIYKANRNHYFLNYGSSEVIDGHVKGTVARYINHSCAPNCHIEKWLRFAYIGMLTENTKSVCLRLERFQRARN